MSIVHHGIEVTAPVVPLVSIPKRRSRTVEFNIVISDEIELSGDRFATVDALDVYVACVMDGDNVHSLAEFTSHTINACPVMVGQTRVTLSKREAEAVFADFYSVARKDGTFPNRNLLLDLCKARNGE